MILQDFYSKQSYPAAEQENRPEVVYRPWMKIEVGVKACIIPLSPHLLSASGWPIWTSKVVAYDKTTGAFETNHVRYVLDYSYEH